MMMVETKTFNEILAEGYEYPEIIPSSLKATISEWYGLRHVVDNDNFKRFFDRILKRDYHRYNELLRIEAGAGEMDPTAYDWLISSYMEREAATDNERTRKETGHDHNHGFKNGRFTPDTEKMSIVTGEDIFGKEETINHGLITQNSGQDVSTTTYGRRNRTVEETRENSASSSDAEATATAKATPASILVDRYDAGEDGEAYATSSSNMISVEKGHTDVWNDELKSPTSISQNLSHALNQSGVARDVDNDSQMSGNDTTTTTNGLRISTSGSDTTQQGGKNEMKRSTREVISGQNVTHDTFENDHSLSSDETEKGSNIQREIYTGRTGLTIAEAMEKAKAYITTTSAWEWFRNQLEPCFMAVYDI